MVRRLLVGLCLAGLLAGANVAPASASRRPTKLERREIIADVKLHGSNWRVSGIRVSTVNRYYAKAAVQIGRNGPSGEIILHLRHGIWHEVFFGQNDFCSARAPRRVLNDLGFRC